MSFKNYLDNLTTNEIVLLLIGIAIPLLFIVLIFFSFSGNSTKFRAAKIFMSRDSWPGDFHKSYIESWQQTNITHGNNYFFDIFFYLDSAHLYSAKALIAPGQIHLLKKGLPIIVKKGDGNRIAIMQISGSD